MTFKKGHQKCWARKWNFFTKKTSFRNLGLRNFFPSPKLGARSPPMIQSTTIQDDSVSQIYSLQYTLKLTQRLPVTLDRALQLSTVHVALPVIEGANPEESSDFVAGRQTCTVGLKAVCA